jgi:putative ABC transport system permease protein
MGTLFQDLRYGVRILLKNPQFTFVTVLTLALGIGANTAIFSIVNAVLIRPLPYPESERLVQGYWLWPKDDTPAVTGLQYAFWKEHSHAFRNVAAFGNVSAGLNLMSNFEPKRARGLQVSESFLQVLGVSPALGRSFSPEEDHPNGPLVAIISDGLWQRDFGGDTAIIGKQMQLNGRSCTIVGVLPPGFQFQMPVDVLIPLQMSVDVKDQGHNIAMVARLRDDISLQQAQSEMDLLLPEFRGQFPNYIGPNERGLRLVPYKQHVVGDVSTMLLLLFAAVAFVLLIACVNIGNILLARSSVRQREMAIRVALGAGRWRLTRQLLTENLLLALAGGFIGLLIATWCMPALLALSPKGLPRLNEINIDRQAVFFTICASVLTSLLFGSLPVLRSTRIDVNARLKASPGRGISGAMNWRLRGLLVVSEVTLTLVLLLGAALLIKSFVKLHEVDLGFNPQNLTAMQIALTSEKYQTTAEAWEFQRQVLENISTLPGVVSAATTSSLPMERGLNIFFTKEGAGEKSGRLAEYRPISSNYFRTIGIPTSRGRTFTDSDMQSPVPLVVINEKLMHLYWSDNDPLEHEISFEGRKWKIIGVVSNIKERGLDKPVEPTVYVPMSLMSNALTVSMNRWFLASCLVRTEGPVNLSASLRDAVRRVDPQMPVASIRPVAEVVNASIASQRFIVLLMGVFAGLAFLMASVGIYGLLSYQVSQRTNEMGIRIALGAQPQDILKLIIGQGLLLTLIGICLGIVIAFAVTRVITSLLFGVSATDPLTFIGIPVLFTVVAFIACYFPARRATKVDPAVALRHE